VGRLQQEIRSRILSLPDTSEQPSRFGAALGFAVDGREFAHFHDGRTLDVRLPRVLQNRLRGDPRVLARPRPSDWMEVVVRRRQDVEDVFGWLQAAHASSRARPRPRSGGGSS